MTKRTTHAEFKKGLLSDLEIRAAYDKYEEEFQLLHQMISARKKSGLTQAQVAKKMKTTTSVISRLESLPTVKRPSPSFATVKKYAHAVGGRLEIKIVSFVQKQFSKSESDKK